jgi:hypothetical protein
MIYLEAKVSANNMRHHLCGFSNLYRSFPTTSTPIARKNAMAELLIVSPAICS